MVATNDVTGDKLVSKELSEQGKANWDLIWPPKKKSGKCEDCKCGGGCDSSQESDRLPSSRLVTKETI